jgi:hypothetical protein
MNRGIKKAKGDVIAMLNADDIYNSNKTIQIIVNKIKKSPKDIGLFFSDVAYFKYKRFENIKRIYNANFNKSDLLKGNMPPHPGSFIKKIIYKKYGYYDETYKIAADYDFFLRNIYFKNLKFKILNTPSVRMRLGGLSTNNFASFIITSIFFVNNLFYKCSWMWRHVTFKQINFIETSVIYSAYFFKSFILKKRNITKK